MIKKLTAVVLAGLALVSLLIFSGRAAASEDMRSCFDREIVASVIHNG